MRSLCYDEDNAPTSAAVQALIDQGANVNSTNANGETALSRAAGYGHLNAVTTLLAAEGILIDHKDKLANTALMMACYQRHTEVAKVLIAALKLLPTFDINNNNSAGNTALTFACGYNRNIEVVELLLSIPNISIRVKNDDRKTAFDRVKGSDNKDEFRALFQGESLPS